MAIHEYLTIDGLTPEQHAALTYKHPETDHSELVVCPFKMMQDRAILKCSDDCALHTADGCGMVSDAALSGGTICPIQSCYHCMSACILHTADGCKLRNLNFGGK